MKHKFFIITFLLTLIFINTNAQDAKTFYGIKHSVGIQANPYYTSFSGVTSNFYKSWLFSARYYASHNSGFSIGPEISNFSYEDDYVSHHYKISTTNYGVFLRYLLDQDGIILVFEVSPFYRNGKSESSKSATYNRPEIIENKDISEISWYGSAGLNFGIYKDKISLDLMVKYDPNMDFENSHFMPTYKLNYHF